ncbi:MAG: nucleotide sugar dehydrogenase [Polyangiaceae bacterium]|nr:nucleotide sugar dehydrogenase [Polyangiaceae bacterium]
MDSTPTRIVILGAGYVGLPLAIAFARQNNLVTNLDIDQEKVDALRRGSSSVTGVDSEELKTLIRDGKYTATSKAECIKIANVVIVCVPTPLSKSREPDLRPLRQALEAVAQFAQRGQLIILESTTYPGTTQELVVPRLEKAGFHPGEDLYVAFSPERIDTGNREYQLHNTPKIVAGINEISLQKALEVYELVVEKLVPVSSPTTAELAKLLENTFRAVNIGLANEVAVMASHLGVDPFEVIDAAATKPFGFMPFSPGPGIGGHCLPVDPLYLSWRMNHFAYEAKFISLADQVNQGMPDYVVNRVADGLNRSRLSLNGSRTLLCGVTYKPEVNDIRESPALEVMRLLESKGAHVDYLDPLVPHLPTRHGGKESIQLDSDFHSYDAVIVTTPHQQLPYDRLAKESRLLLDTRGAFRHRNISAPNIWSL